MLAKPDSADAERRAWIEEFAAAARRPLAVRLHYAFLRTYKPVLDDAPYRSFDRMADYRHWCDTELPAWLGYGSLHRRDDEQEVGSRVAKEPDFRPVQ